MKKFMKAIAFVTVMCMALSTVAFAANGAVKSTTDDKTVIVTVTQAGANDQVALMVVEAQSTPDYDFSNPLYIDQKGMSDGSAVFTAKIADDVDAVDVYVGYAANTDNKAVWVGAVTLKEAITEVTIVKTDTDVITENVEALEQTGTGVAIKFDVKAPAGVAATQMIWAIRYTEKGVAKVKYSDAFNVTGYEIGTTLETGIQLGLAFLNGSDLNEIDPVELTGVDAIFLFEGADGFEQEVLTNSADAANKAE